MAVQGNENTNNIASPKIVYYEVWGGDIMKDVVVVECPICKTLNPEHVNYCVKCGHWLLDTVSPGKVIKRQSSKTSAGKGVAIFVAVVVVIILIVVAANSKNMPSSSSIVSNSLTIGTVVDKSSPNLAVSGQDYSSGEMLYARLYDKGSFKSTSLVLMVEKQDGAGWDITDSRPFSADPNDNIEVMPFTISSSGKYQVSVDVGNASIATATFTSK
jgi:hypothetical protein